ncbi:hypothetical protein LTR15_009398 [Elasticomyces elasticus]|nr:hypothetical protein LTR15_009398 [Elasticomyces elasticus]
MAETTAPDDTAAWLQEQWSNPSDIFTVLLIIGGDIVRAAIAQLCAGPVPYLTPVSFSFGWVSYAVSAMRSAVGDNRLMPEPELVCKLINAESGYARSNHSWVLSRMLRDFDHWRPRACDQEKANKLAELRSENEKQRAQMRQQLNVAVRERDKQDTIKELERLPRAENLRVPLRVSVWVCRSATGRGSGDWVYWVGILVSVVQMGIGAVPWGFYGEWFTFLVAGTGTALAYSSAALPQWREEKVVVRRLQKSKGVFLTEGNGADDVILILCEKGDLDLEALAAPQRELHSPWTTRIFTTILAVLWIAFLITVAGWKQHTWYLVGIGIIGMLHNVGVAGMKRQPKAWGIDLQYRGTIVQGKVMEVLWNVEESYPGAGQSLIAEFFPGKLFPREETLWKYCERRRHVWKESKSPTSGDGSAKAWTMPPLRGPAIGTDIPEAGEYVVTSRPATPPGR